MLWLRNKKIKLALKKKLLVKFDHLIMSPKEGDVHTDSIPRFPTWLLALLKSDFKVVSHGGL